MKLGFEIAYVLVTIALIVFLIRAFYNKKKIAHDIQWIMGFACVSVVTSIVQLATDQPLVADLSFGLFFISLDWLLISIIYFANDYCGTELERYVHPLIIVLISVADSIQLLLNPLFQHAYRVYPVDRGETLYWNYDQMTAFRIHLCWCYILVAIIVLIFWDKRMHVPRMYKVKYDHILLILSIVVVLDALHLIFRTLIDFSVLGFPLAAMAIYYYAVEFMPHALVNQTLGMTVDEMQDGVIVTDADNRAIYSNACVMEMLDLQPEYAPHFNEMFETWCKRHYQSMDENFIYDWTRIKGDQKQYLKVQYRRLLDEKQQYVGCYLNIQERTEEIEMLLRERHAATHDYLTGLYNREYFYKQAERCLKLHPDEHYLMICSDVGNFKMINDVFGSEAADQLLIDIANALREQTINGEVYGRLVNDQFALLMRKRDYREMKFAEKTTEVMKIANEISYPLKVYLGVYEIDDLNLPISVMCDRAMFALETIKGDYQKLVAYYDETLRHHILEEKELAVGLDRAIDEGEIELYIQPQITVDGRCDGGEALVRWNHPRRGLLLPGAFIPSFERNGLIVKLDLHVWELACRQLQKWKEEGFTDRYLSVNISPKDFFFVDIYKEFNTLVQRYGIDRKNLKLEITESAMMTDLPKQLALIKRLRAAGFIVEMDDFGSGYSSLNMLKDICVDVLKIDMDFLRESEREERSRTILKMIVALAKELGMPVITEGVETKEHVDFLTKIGCDVFQGYFFGRPMKIADYEKKYMQTDEQKES